MAALSVIDGPAGWGGEGGLDSTDAALLKGLSVDGRRSASDLARELGISRAYASRKLRALLQRKGVSVRAFSSPVALGYRAGAMTGIRVVPGGMAAAVEALRPFPGVCQLMTASGREDLVMFSLFPSAADLSAFLAEDLGRVPGVRSTETLIMSDWRVRDGAGGPGAGFRSLLPAPSAGRGGPEGCGPGMKGDGAGTGLDLVDLKILREIELDPRQQVSALARKVGVSQRSASGRLRSLMEDGVVRVAVGASPFEAGAGFFPMVGMKVSPGEAGAVAARAESFPGVLWVARVSGRHDLVVGAVFAGPHEASRFLWQELAAVPGILSMETGIGLEVRKWSLPLMAGALLDSLARGRAGPREAWPSPPTCPRRPGGACLHRLP